MRSHIVFAVLLWGAAVVSTAAWGGTLIEIRSHEGGTQRVLIDGTRARIEGEPGTYVLMDADKRTYFVVDDAERQIFDMSGMLRQSGTSAAPPLPEDVALIRQGAGPTIAGFPTEHYVLRAGRTNCQDVYLSRKLLEDARLQAFYTAFQGMGQAELEAATLAMLEPCDRADLVADRLQADRGFPMRTVHSSGLVREEVIRVVLDHPVPRGAFNLPADYRRLGYEDVPELLGGHGGERLEELPEGAGTELLEGIGELLRQMQEGTGR